MRARKGILIAAMVLLAGCSSRSGNAAMNRTAAFIEPPHGTHAPPGTFLAYEHSVTIKLAEAEIQSRIAAAQAGCLAQSFGYCVVLDVEQHGGEDPNGTLTVRITPKGVEPMIRQAGQGGDVGDRSTKAEDLADAVQNTSLQQARLEKEHARLLEFEARRDLAVADMIALSKQLADVETRMEETQGEAAQQQRRIDTNLLTLHFEPPSGRMGRSDIGHAFRDFGQIMQVTIAFMIRALAVLIPLSVVVAGIVVLLRWRRRSKKSAG